MFGTLKAKSLFVRRRFAAVTKASLHVLHTLLHMDVEYLLHLLATAHTTPHREFGVLHMCATPTVHLPRPLPRPQGRKRVGGIHPLPSWGRVPVCPFRSED